MKEYNIILIRGLARESGHWGSFIDLLESQDYCKRAYPLDLPGCGMYHKISAPLTISENAEFLMSKIKELALDKEKFIVFSISLGSMVAIEMASRYPNCVHSLYITNTSIANLSPFYQRLQLKAMKHLYKIILSKDEEEREGEVLKMVSNNSDHWSNIKNDWAEIAKQRPVSAANFVRQLLAASYYRLPRQKPRIPIYVFASEKDEMVNVNCSKALANKWDLPIYLNLQAGHELYMDEPEWVLERIQETMK